MMNYNLSKEDTGKAGAADLTAISLDRFSEDEKKEITAIKDGICFNYEAISGYGRDAVKKLTEFSTQILDAVKVKDAPEIEGMLLSLVGELNQFNTEELKEEKKGLFRRLFHTDRAEAFVGKYKSISSVIGEMKTKLEQAEYQLQKDVKVSEMYLQMNHGYIQNLEKYIAAADMRILEEREWLEEERKKTDTNDTLAVQELAVKEADLKALERKAFNLRIQRTIAIQNIPQLMLIKDGDTALISKIDDSINQAVPLWESQIVIGLQALRQKTGAKIAKSVSDTTNSLLRKNAEVLRDSAISVAEENERDIVDMETLQEVNNALIETINGVREVQKRGEEKRKESIKELAQIQSQLNQTLLSAKM